MLSISESAGLTQVAVLPEARALVSVAIATAETEAAMAKSVAMRETCILEDLLSADVSGAGIVTLYSSPWALINGSNPLRGQVIIDNVNLIKTENVVHKYILEYPAFHVRRLSYVPRREHAILMPNRVIASPSGDLSSCRNCCHRLAARYPCHWKWLP